MKETWSELNQKGIESNNFLPILHTLDFWESLDRRYLLVPSPAVLPKSTANTQNCIQLVCCSHAFAEISF